MAPASAGLDDHCDGERSKGAAATGELKVAAIVDWFGICDVDDLLKDPSTRALAVGWLGDKPNREQIARLVSPITYVRPGLPPIISVHGDSDPGVPYAQKQRFHEALESSGATHELITIKGGGHGIFTEADYLASYAAIRAFLTKHLGERA